MSMKKLIELDDFEGIKKAVIAGKDDNTTDRSETTALMRAIVKKDKEMAQWLLIQNANVNQSEKDGWTALHFAAQEGFLDGIRLLLENGVYVDSKDVEGNTPLWRVSMSCPAISAKDAANILVEAGARKDTKNNHDVSPKDISPELFK